VGETTFSFSVMELDEYPPMAFSSLVGTFDNTLDFEFCMDKKLV